MIIKINEKQEVIFTAEGVAEIGATVDNVTTFRVESKPEREAGKILCFNPETLGFYHTDRPLVDEEAIKARRARLAERRAAEQKKAEALKWLTDNDWMVNKRVLGEWAEDDERWIEYLERRAGVRAAYDEAVAVLNAEVI